MEAFRELRAPGQLAADGSGDDVLVAVDAHDLFRQVSAAFDIVSEGGDPAGQQVAFHGGGDGQGVQNFHHGRNGDVDAQQPIDGRG